MPEWMKVESPMTASVSALHGYNKARGPEAEHKSVAVIGDSTFIHSGITGPVSYTHLVPKGY